MEYAPFLSIVTPTYNRCELLQNCFASLLCQSCLDFEWIIVDDGSTDQTETVVSGFHRDFFPIRYLRKENGGKHTALNAALSHIRGKYVLILDSDDTLTADAVSKIKREWGRYAANTHVGVLAFLKGFSIHEPNCISPIAGQPVDYFRCKRKILRSYDCCEVIRTDILREYPFPEFEKETFLPETALWSRVGQKYAYVYVNEVIYLCEYLAGGLTQSGRKLRIRHPMGGLYTAQLNMHPRNHLTGRIKNGLLYCCYGFFAEQSFCDILRSASYWILTAFCLFPGWILYRYWDIKYR